MICGPMQIVGVYPQSLFHMLSFPYFFRAVDLDGRLLGASVRSVSDSDEARNVAFDFAQCMYYHFNCDVKVLFQSCRAPYHGPRVIYFPPF